MEFLSLTRCNYADFAFFLDAKKNDVDKDVFHKVWRTDDVKVDMDTVHAEWMYHNRAFKAGVPVSPPLFFPTLCGRPVLGARNT